MKNTNITFTDYMNKSLVFRTQLITYCELRPNDLDRKVNSLNLLDKLDAKSEKEQDFRNDFYKWLSNKKGFSTIKLREFCKIVGYDYWGNLKEANIIDTFDSCSCVNRKNK